jgi:hypothetical protein
MGRVGWKKIDVMKSKKENFENSGQLGRWQELTGEVLRGIVQNSS